MDRLVESSVAEPLSNPRGGGDGELLLPVDVLKRFRTCRSERATGGFALLSVGSLLVAAGCSRSFHLAKAGLPPTFGAQSLVVDYPPPPAEVEELGEVPGEPCVWVDGHWNWVARRWRWQTGGWVVPPEDCYRSTPMMVFLAAEQASPLYYWPPQWYPLPDRDAHACVSAVPCGAALESTGA